MYNHERQSSSSKVFRQILAKVGVVLFVAVIALAGWYAYNAFAVTSVTELLGQNLSVADDVDTQLSEKVKTYTIENDIRLESQLSLSTQYVSEKPEDSRVVQVLVPVADKYSVVRDIENPFEEGVIADFDENPSEGVKYVDINVIGPEQTLLSVDGEYYLDTFDSGAVYKTIVLEGEQQGDYASFTTDYDSLSSNNVFSMNTTGVTALTREMMNDLNAGVEPTFFSDKIGEFLSAADITHVSNEVSFKEGCGYSATLFCSPPEFIETLKASGVDVVELTGNHNNDLGAEFNTSTIELYSELGWAHVGGGLNNEDAGKPYIVEQDGTTFGMLAYNYPDAPNGGAISGANKAGANAYTDEKMKADIASLREQVDFVQVNIQFWECYAYPDGYVEFPECDLPIGEQEPVFKSVVDAGADMVVGSSAHQPQTYEQYGNGWIYYGLGNLYFDQDRWPGTERGLVLTNYYHDKELLQTRITPTVYGSDFQTRKMTNEESEYLLGRLNAAR